jgi:uroporphyrinogen decarboxylase
MHTLLEKLTKVITNYLLLQIESGAQIVQIFDTWAGNLSSQDYQEFALPYTKQIISDVRNTGTPCTLYINGSNHLLADMVQSGSNAISIDWRTPFKHARQLVGQEIVLQGNLDPSHLYGTEQDVYSRTRSMIQQWEGQRGYIANLGHGILQTTPPENALAFVQAVKDGWQK